jgi:hypothetical protein
METRNLLRSTFDMLIRAKSEERTWNSKYNQSQSKVADLGKLLDEAKQANNDYHTRLLLAQGQIEKAKLSVVKLSAQNGNIYLV